MTLSELQSRVRQANAEMKAPFSSGTQCMLALTEEVGEVAQEVALLERVGSKASWQKDGSVERLADEMTHAMNCLLSLANYYGIDLEKVYNPDS
jgi:NTP pyrophosphatase (non-canonical NTP hydrolase)